jgi:catechol 2,3-dioxygenase-like lactoylglutathione lyase family enzyme
VVFNVSDLERITRFWTEIMGFHITDRNDRGMVFLRNASDHHTMGLAPAGDTGKVPNTDGVRFSHCALEVGSVSELYTIRNFLRAKGVLIQFEGRRGPGCNVGVEFQDPDGFNIEIYAAMD